MMLKFYFNLSPNPMKVALFLEEAALPYEPMPIDARTGEQFQPGFLEVNPNGKLPAIVDGDTTVFDSNAILLYLGEKTGQFVVKAGDPARGDMLSWLMFVATGLGPFSGQAVHFKHFAPEKVPYAHERYQFEADRHFRVMDAHLAARSYMAGEAYSIVDMAVWGWARMVPFVLGDDAWGRYPNVRRLFDEISARPAAAKVEALRSKFESRFKAGAMDDETRGHMFKHLKAA